MTEKKLKNKIQMIKCPKEFLDKLINFHSIQIHEFNENNLLSFREILGKAIFRMDYYLIHMQNFSSILGLVEKIMQKIVPFIPGIEPYPIRFYLQKTIFENLSLEIFKTNLGFMKKYAIRHKKSFIHKYENLAQNEEKMGDNDIMKSEINNGDHFGRIAGFIKESIRFFHHFLSSISSLIAPTKILNEGFNFISHKVNPKPTFWNEKVIDLVSYSVLSLQRFNDVYSMVNNCDEYLAFTKCLVKEYFPNRLIIFPNNEDEENLIHKISFGRHNDHLSHFLESIKKVAICHVVWSLHLELLANSFEEYKPPFFKN